MRKGFLIYEEMREYLTIYEKAVSHIGPFHGSLLNFPIHEENLIFFFIRAIFRSVPLRRVGNQRGPPKNWAFLVGRHKIETIETKKVNYF